MKQTAIILFVLLLAAFTVGCMRCMQNKKDESSANTNSTELESAVDAEPSSQPEKESSSSIAPTPSQAESSSVSGSGLSLSDFLNKLESATKSKHGALPAPTENAAHTEAILPLGDTQATITCDPETKFVQSVSFSIPTLKITSSENQQKLIDYALACAQLLSPEIQESDFLESVDVSKIKPGASETIRVKDLLCSYKISLSSVTIRMELIDE